MYITKYFLTHKFKSGRSVLVNTLSGSIDNASEQHLSTIDKIRNNVTEGLDENIVFQLRQNKYIFDNYQQEQDLINTLYEQKKEKMKEEPLVYVVYLTYHCNIRCSYCCYDYLKKHKTVMNTDDIDHVFSSIEQIQKKEGRRKAKICLFGGEPFNESNYEQVKYFFRKVSEHIKREETEGRECRFMIFTNGVSIPYYSKLLKKYKNIIEQVLVTLLGSENMHNKLRKFPDGTGTFNAVVEGIETLLNLGIQTWPVTNIDKSNVAQLPDIIDYANKKGWIGKPAFAGYYAGRIKYYKSEEPNAISESEFISQITQTLKNNKLAQQTFNFGDMRVLKGSIEFYREAQKDGKETKLFHRFYGCSSGALQQYSFGIGGKVYTCSGSMGIEKYSLGEFSPTLNIDNNKAEWWTSRDVMSMSKCRECKVAFLCGGGCAYAANEINGSERKPYCTDAEKILHAYLDSVDEGVEIRYRDLLRDWA